MKNIANRILALIVALTVLLMPAAMAAEQNMAVLSIGNFEITMDGETLSLPVTLQLGGGADVENARGSALVRLLVGDQVGGTVYGALEDGQIKAFIDGMKYGLYIPLEDAMAMAEEQIGGSMADMTSVISPELEAALANLITSSAALETNEAADPALLAALGITTADAGTTELELYDRTVSAAATSLSVAPMSLQAINDALSASVTGYAEYWENYLKLFDLIAAQTGEEIDMTEVMTALTFGAEGMLYTFEEGMSIEIELALTAEGETIVLPCTVVAIESETGSLVSLSMNFEVDSETVILSFETSDNNDGATSDFDMNFLAAVADSESGETEGEFFFDVNTSDTPEGVTLGLYLSFDDGYEPFTAAVDYIGTHAETEGDITSWDGLFSLTAEAEGSAFEFAMDTNLTLSAMPEGELLTLGESSINLLEADEDVMEQFASDAQIPLFQLLGVLMQSESIAEIMGGLLG